MVFIPNNRLKKQVEGITKPYEALPEPYEGLEIPSEAFYPSNRPFSFR